MLGRRMAPRLASVALLAFVALAFGCAPAIGGSCNTSFDCSINGDRQCDTTQPGGVCTVFGCEADTCPDDAVCVRWRPEPSRLTFNACMKRCATDADCRVDQGYVCLEAGDILTTETGGDVVAEVIDEERMDGTRSQSFCVSTDPAGGM